MDNCPVLVTLKHRIRPRNTGFSLIELLIVIGIIGVLATFSIYNFQNSQKKARDVERKSNLRQIANALEAYMSDHSNYPFAGIGVDSGKIKGCTCTVGTEACTWDPAGSPREFCDAESTVYMSVVPTDPTNDPTFCYKSTGTKFQLYAKLEVPNDPEIGGPYSCASRSDYNFGISSSNIKPGEDL